MLIFMNMRNIFLQLTATDSTRLKIDHSPTSSKEIKIEQKQVHCDKLRTILDLEIFLEILELLDFQKFSLFKRHKTNLPHFANLLSFLINSNPHHDQTSR
jgi:hypothetical protein